MATTAKPLFRGAATTNTATVLYTVPAATTTVVSNMIVTNTAATAATFTIGFAGTSVNTTTAIAANATIYIDMKQALVATNTITGGASATTVSFHISGVEVS
jgi:hypothetical protein